MTDHHLPALGIIMLDVHVPRITGDVGNATTWPWPVLFHVVPGANVIQQLQLPSSEIRAGRIVGIDHQDRPRSQAFRLCPIDGGEQRHRLDLPAAALGILA